jgi:Zn-dependent M28 family amino/carboxypeptidase
MEMARALAGCAPRRSIRLLFFSNEEVGTVGSQAYAASLRNQVSPDDVVGVIVADMIGYGPDDEDLDIAGRTADAALVNTMSDAVETWTSLVAAPRIDDYCG